MMEESGFALNGLWVAGGILLIFLFLIGIRIIRPTHRALIERLGNTTVSHSPVFIGLCRVSINYIGLILPSKW